MKKVLILFCGLLALTANAENYTGGGNGGVGLVCLNPQQSIKVESVTLFDFAEGSILYGDQITEDLSKTEEQYLQETIQKMASKSPYLGEMLSWTLKDIMRKEILNIGPYILDLTADTQYGLRFRICPDDGEPVVRQVANYLTNINELRIDEKYLAKMSPMNRAGLFIHEALYRIYRQYFNHTNSDKARRLTSLLISNATLTNKELNTLLTHLENHFFVNPILKFEKDVITNWANAHSFEQAESVFNSKLSLPFGITYKTTMTSAKLPPYQMMVMERVGSGEFVHRKLKKLANAKIILSIAELAGGAALYAVPGAFLIGLIQVGEAGVGIFVGAALGGIGALAVTAATPWIAVGTIAGIRSKRVDNYLGESYQCVKTNTDCSGKNFKHLNKIYTGFVKDYPQHDHISLKEYAMKVVSLAYENRFYNKKADRFLMRKEMKQVVHGSF